MKIKIEIRRGKAIVVITNVKSRPVIKSKIKKKNIKKNRKKMIIVYEMRDASGNFV